MTTHSGEFADFDEDFKKAQEAQPSAAVGRLPEGPYKVVCCAIDKDGDGKKVDFEIFESTGKTKGFKLFFEILEPEVVKDKKTNEEVKTKGEIHEHVFWITKKNLPFVKRDIKVVLGRDLQSLSELTTIQWAGKTCEIGLKDEMYNGFNRSKVSFMNAWSPKAGEKAQGTDGGKEKVKEPAAAGGPAPLPDF